MAVGDKIAELRNRRGLSQYQLAKMLNVATSTLGMYETNKRKPNVEMLEKIADVFDVTTDYLLGRDKADTKNPQNDLSRNQKLVAYSIDPDISDEERQAIIEMVQAAKKFRRRI